MSARIRRITSNGIDEFLVIDAFSFTLPVIEYDNQFITLYLVIQLSLGKLFIPSLANNQVLARCFQICRASLVRGMRAQFMRNSQGIQV